LPCKICKTNLIYIYNFPTCPKCEHVSLVPYDDAVRISDHLLEKFKNAFFEIVKTFKKNHLLANIFWQREKEMRRFLRRYSTLDIARLSSCTLLLRRVFQMSGFLEQSDVTEEDAIRVIKHMRP